MDKVEFYKILDIENADEFKYYENLSALMEEDKFIEENLIKDLLREADKSYLEEHMDSFFESFLGNLPDSETELYITVENIKRMLGGMISDNMDEDEINSLASEIAKFRKWYIQETNVIDRSSGIELSLRDARYNIVAGGFLGESCDYDFRPALDYEIEGYSMNLSDMITGYDE